MQDDFNDLENINIEEGNIAENNDETSSNSFLKIDPIKNLDISNLKGETKTEQPKKSQEKQTIEDINGYFMFSWRIFCIFKIYG